MGYIDTIRLGFGNNLIIGNAPPAIQLAHVASVHNAHVELESFGLFDSANQNFSSYYPDVKAEDLIPKDGDFVEPIVRALSEVIVHKKYNPVDFSMNSILKKSMPLLKGQTVYPNHEMAVGNELGAVANVDWELSTKQSGIIIPAGINARLKIDGKSNPKVARALNMDPPSIHSTSVTVQFTWEKSHASLTEQEFFTKLATYDKDGQLIRRIATGINKYDEISFVGHGADPFAQIKDKDGNINNPQHADRSYNSEQKQKQKVFFFDFKQDIVSNSEKNTIPDETNDNEETELKNTDNMNFLTAFLASFGTQLGLTAASTEAEVTAALTAKLAELSKFAALGLTAEQITALKTNQPDTGKLAELQAFQTKTLTDHRTKVLSLYNKTVATGKENAAIVTMINTATDPAVLDALETDYLAKLEALYPSSCQKCGSTEVSKASSVQGNSEGGNSTSSQKTSASAGASLLEKRKLEQLKSSNFYSDTKK